MKNLPSEYCPICAALQYWVDHPKPGEEEDVQAALRAHQRRHDFGFYDAMCPVCEDFLDDLARWRDLSDDEVLQANHEYETHYETTHQHAGLAQSLWPGAQVTKH